MQGSGGLGAVSSGISESLIGLVLLLVILGLLAGCWKLAKIIWAMFSN
jgi:hypothetical protein